MNTTKRTRKQIKTNRNGGKNKKIEKKMNEKKYLKSENLSHTSLKTQHLTRKKCIENKNVVFGTCINIRFIEYFVSHWLSNENHHQQTENGREIHIFAIAM